MDWLEYEGVEPMGEWRADARALSLFQRMGVVFGGDKPDEVILPMYPYFQKKVAADDAMAALKAINAAEAEKRAQQGT